MLKNTIRNFFDANELNQIWHEFNTNPRWQYRRMSGGQWFWWYMFLGSEQFRANMPEQWQRCTANIWRHLYDRVVEFAGPNFVPYRYIINGQTLGQDGFPHSDFARNLDNRSTFLAYLNTEWDPAWGGETCFYHNQVPEYTEQYRRLSVTPEPGLLIEYDSRIVHQGQPPQVPNLLRVTLAIQGEYT